MIQPTNYLLPLLVVTTIFERFNIFITSLDFSLKLSLILLPVVGLILLVKKRLRFNPTFLFPFLAAVLAVETLSIFFSYDRLQSFQVVVFHFLMAGLFYLFIWTVKKIEDLERVVMAWGAGALAVSLYGFWQFWRYLSGRSPAIFLDKLLGAKSLPAATFVHQFLGRTLLRPSSTFIDTNTAASFVGIAILLGLGFLLAANPSTRAKHGTGRGGRRKRLFFASVLVVSSIFFAMALSRSAILGLGVGLIIFAALNLREKISKRLLIGVVVTSLLVLLTTVAWLSFSRIRIASNIARVGYAQEAVEMFKRNPLLGVGLGNFEPYYTEVLKPAQTHGYSHSIFLTWLGETGVLGLISNLALIGAALLFLGRETLKHQVATAWRFRLSALLAGFVALVIANIFHAHYGLEFTWVLLGLTVSGYYLARVARGKKQPPPVGGVPPKAGEARIKILGIQINNVTMDEAIAWVKGLFKKGKKAYVVTPNPEMVMQARKDPEFAQILNKADLATPDGIGLIWASRILGTPLRERVTGTDLFIKLCAEAARRGGKVFLLGGQGGLPAGQVGVAAKAAQELKRRYPKLRVAGTFAGDGSERGDKETVVAIKRAGPVDLLFVAYGGGKEERWISRNLPKTPVKVAMGVGGAFDFVAGKVPRAPKLIQRLGLEWAFRLIKQPSRIRRQLALIPFAALVFRETLRNS